MSHTIGVFDFKMESGGMSIIPRKNFITTAAMSIAELDEQIALAKSDLDKVAQQAKLALEKRASQSIL